MSEASLRQLLHDVQLLELVARRNATGMLSGEYASVILGSGLVFHEARKYVQGEPARLIDWNITARAGEPGLTGSACMPMQLAQIDQPVSVCHQ